MFFFAIAFPVYFLETIFKEPFMSQYHLLTPYPYELFHFPSIVSTLPCVVGVI
jgi:hypothetical protein